MIRSIFDTGDLPEDEKTVDKSVESSESEIAESTEAFPKVEIPDEGIAHEIDTFVSPMISSGEPEKQIIDEIKEAEVLHTLEQMPDVSAVSLSELENVVDAGDNFLEFEDEIAKIEEEIRLENKSKAEVTANPFIEKTEQLGIVTAALEKGQKEIDAKPALENLLFDTVHSEDSTTAPASANTGFILPNRTEPVVENQGFILPNLAESSTDDAPNIIEFKPESKAEIIRKSGLAWSAGIAFFASVVFLLILGWFADLLLGTAPWGAVGGIIVGSIIGFVQLFRLTSQILKNSDQ